MKIDSPIPPSAPASPSLRLAEVRPAGQSLASGAATGAAAGAGEGFDAALGSAVSRSVAALDRTQRGAEVEIARAVAGESPDLHRTVIALQQADLNFQLALQVRNKFVGAYEEIMRMQV